MDSVPAGLISGFIFGLGLWLAGWLVDGIKALVGRMAKGA